VLMGLQIAVPSRLQPAYYRVRTVGCFIAELCNQVQRKNVQERDAERHGPALATVATLVIASRGGRGAGWCVCDAVLLRGAQAGTRYFTPQKAGHREMPREEQKPDLRAGLGVKRDFFYSLHLG